MKKEYFEVILEDLNSKMDAVIESHLTSEKKLTDVKDRVEELVNEMGFVKLILRDHENNISELNKIHPNFSHQPTKP